MPFMLDPTAVLQREGCDVRNVSGYLTRSAGGSLSPIGIALHHTASSRTSGDSGALGIVTHGRSDLSGPLCNIHISRSGIVTIVALGKANHFGKGSGVVLAATQQGRPPGGDARALGLADTIVGNGYYIGIEIENDGIGEPWSPGQVDAIIRVCAALCRQYGWSAARVINHREWTSRKSDCSLRVDWRALTAAQIAGEVLPLVLPVQPFSPADAYLRKGSTGTTVWNLQQALGIPTDGQFGPQTDAAVRAFQASHGLVVDGIVGPATLAKIAGNTPAPAPDPAVVAALAAAAPAAKPKAPWWQRTLRFGSVGPDVGVVQNIVGAGDDGIYGSQTVARVSDWQRAHGLVADGIVGPRTAAAMNGAAPAAPPPPAGPAAWWNRTLSVGDRGPDVAQVQRIVGAGNDGIFGKITNAKVKAWQAANGLSADGIVGRATATKMNGR